jgi:hypothetical protein
VCAARYNERETMILYPINATGACICWCLLDRESGIMKLGSGSRSGVGNPKTLTRCLLSDAVIGCPVQEWSQDKVQVDQKF